MHIYVFIGHGWTIQESVMSIPSDSSIYALQTTTTLYEGLNINHSKMLVSSDYLAELNKLNVEYNNTFITHRSVFPNMILTLHSKHNEANKFVKLGTVKRIKIPNVITLDVLISMLERPFKLVLQCCRTKLTYWQIQNVSCFKIGQDEIKEEMEKYKNLK